jgi:hypothetical protein
MFTRVKGRAAQTPATEKGVPELLAALADVRARKEQLEQEEKEIIAATRARLRQQQEMLEELKRKVNGCGIEVHDDQQPTAPSTLLSV